VMPPIPSMAKNCVVTRILTTLDRIEEYYDAVPRSACRVEDHGPLTLFVSRSGSWPYYARPTPGRAERVTSRAILAVRARQRALGVPQAFEWVAELNVGIRAAAERAGLDVREHSLLAVDRAAWRPTPAPDGVAVRVVDGDVPDLGVLRAVANLAFEEPGTAVGLAGPAELAAAAAATPDATIAHLRERIRLGLTAMAAARGAEGPLAVGSHQPVGAVTEVTGVGTLPAARRRGLAAAVTTELVRDAFDRGLELVFLAAADEDVARLYGRLGFRRLATALVAEPADVEPGGADGASVMA